MKNEWGTPKEIFNILDEEFHFTLDPCANKTRLLKKDVISLDILDNGLKYNWHNHRVFVNPPYSDDNIRRWIIKCFEERQSAEVIVLLIPVTKTGTGYFHRFVIHTAEIRFIKGRISFVPLEGQKSSSNPLYSMICIWRKRRPPE